MIVCMTSSRYIRIEAAEGGTVSAKSGINEGGMIAKDGWLIAGFLPVEVENNMLAARQAAYDKDPEDENGRNFLGLRDNTSTFDQDMWGFIKETDFIYDLRDPDAY